MRDDRVLLDLDVGAVWHGTRRQRRRSGWIDADRNRRKRVTYALLFRYTRLPGCCKLIVHRNGQMLKIEKKGPNRTEQNRDRLGYPLLVAYSAEPEKNITI